MVQGSALSERLHTLTVRQILNNIPQCVFARNLEILILNIITQYHENPFTAQGRKPTLRPMTFDPSLTLKTSIIQWWTLQCGPQTGVKTLPCKASATSLGPSSSEMPTFQVVSGNGHRVLRAKEEEDHQWSQCKIQKPRCGLWVTCTSVKAPLSPLLRRRTRGTIYAFIQKSQLVSSGQCQSTAWLRSEWVQVADRPACHPQLPPIKKCLKCKMQRTTQPCWAANDVYQPWMGKNSTFNTWTISAFSPQTLAECC